MPHDIRDTVVDFVTDWSDKTEIPKVKFIRWLSLSKSKFYNWGKRYGKVNEHNARLPRDSWLEEWEKTAIIDFHDENPLEGYRRLTFMMLDRDVVAVSPSSVYRVLREAGLLSRWKAKPTSKGKGFKQPEKPHEHWHVDITYINICGTFYYLLAVLDGCSRYVVHWEIRESMTEAEAEIILQRAHEKHPGVRPRIITDNGPQFIAKDFKEFIRISGMTHVKTSPYYPQSNGKVERWNGTLKTECIRPKTPLDLEDSRRVVDKFVRHYNEVRLHSAIGYVTPKDRLEGRHEDIFTERDRKLEEARERRKTNRQKAWQASMDEFGLKSPTINAPGETEAGSAEEQPAKG
ncbi:MAG: IS3 family transposase [Planctomycetota bacterium]|nr:IS3 family transposase [Planctomycetota bacterium]